MQEKIIITIGEPSIKNLTPGEANVFYSTLLSKVIEYYQKLRETDNSPDKDEVAV